MNAPVGRKSARSGKRGASSPLSAYTLALADELKRGDWKRLGGLDAGGLPVEIAVGPDSVWLRVGEDAGMALRTAHAPSGPIEARLVEADDGRITVQATGAAGTWLVETRLLAADRPALRATTTFTPAVELFAPPGPRDLYLLGRGGDPARARGQVEAAQRGMNTGVVYLRSEDGPFCNALYLQDFGSLNPYFLATETKPEGVVGGVWPELGYQWKMPDPGRQLTLPGGRPMVVSDVILAFSLRAAGQADDEEASALAFLQLMATAYPHLCKPVPELRDWPARAARTLRDLQRSPKATVRKYGAVYAHPYTAAEYPDSMVQISILGAFREWEAWTGKPIPFLAELARGLGRFYDPKLKTLRRYLPDVGDDKDADEVDSWYLYHPLLNLGRMALRGDGAARDLLLQSLDYAAKAARHFNYVWPIQYNVKTFEVITASRDDEGRGQTDVGGIYAYVMLQAFELTGDDRWLEEAKAGLTAARSMGFELEYQANLTAWGAAACARLWRITEEQEWLRQSYVFLAGFLHNCQLWESRLGPAALFPNFMGASALHNSQYMAIYECFDSFTAFEGYLRDGGAELPPEVRLLVSEYGRHALSRAWFYYPDALPADVLSDSPRNGHIDRKLSFPLEDLYIDGQQAGQVGQEIYGCGAAAVFASHAFHKIPGAPFMVFGDVYVAGIEPIGPRSVSVRFVGAPGATAHVSLVRLPRKRSPLSAVRVTARERAVRPRATTPDRIDYRVPADARLVIDWS